MITLLTFRPAFGQPAASPFCVKAIGMLNIAGVAWQREDMDDPRKMPNQKLPVIRVNGELIADSENIRTYLEAQGADFDPGLSDDQKAQSRAIIRMAEEHMYFYQLLDRWDDDAVWAILQEEFFGFLPKLLRGLIGGRIRAGTLAATRAQGVGRLSKAERLERVEHDLRAITALLTDQFLFGDQITAADLSVAAILQGMIGTPVATPLQQRVAQDPTLSAYVDRVKPVWSTS